MEKSVVMVSAVRTPFDKFGGAMRAINSIDLSIKVLQEVVDRVGVPKETVEEIILGECMHAEMAMYQNVPARQALLKAGFPPETISATVDRACCSSMYSIELAYSAIANGDRDCMIAAGADNMSNIPYLVPPAMRWGMRIGAVEMDDQLFPLGYSRTGWTPVALDAGKVALEYGVSREEQDRWALRSQLFYAKAQEKGVFKEEIVPITIPDKKKGDIIIDSDTNARPDTTYEALAKLKTVYDSPTITAGNAPGMNTGASAILLMSEEKAKEMGLEPIAYLRATASVADKAEYIPRVPATAIQKALKKTNLTLDDLKLIEINEAFAAMPLVSTKILGGDDTEKVEKIRNITNVNGGAIAIGHPVGATAARLVMTLAFELRRRGGGYGAASICGGLAQGDCVILEVK